jgi:hypothetical protein
MHDAGCQSSWRDVAAASKTACMTRHPGLEYPQFLTPEMSRMPDFIGRDEFLEVK